MLSVESLAPATKKWRRVIRRFRSAAPATQHDLQNLRNQNFKGATPLTKWALRPLSMSMSKFPICCPCHEKCSFSSNPPRLPTFLESIKKKHEVFDPFCNVQNSLRLPRKMQFWRWKVARACGNLTVLTYKPAPRHNESSFFDISTSQSGSVQKRLGADTFLDFANRHRATTRAHFCLSFSSWALRTRRFSELTFWASRATKHGKNTAFRCISRLFYSLSRTCASLDCLSLDRLTSIFWQTIAATLDIVGSLTSKFPSINVISYHGMSIVKLSLLRLLK